MTSSPDAMDSSIIVEEPTELPETPTDEAKAARKARRQTAIYPNTLRSTPKPFSRSAAKRESVMALGSIEHLQHYFTKTGIAAKQKPNGKNKSLVPAIGGARHVRAASSVTSIPELPPSPMVPTSASSRPPFVHLPKTYEVNPDQLRPGVIRDLKAVDQAWKLDPSTPFNVLSTLRITTRAIRSVRDYVVSLPDDGHGRDREASGSYRSAAFSAPGLQTRSVQQGVGSSGQPSLASVLQQAVAMSPRPSVATLSPRPSMATLSPRPSMATLSPRPSLATLSPRPSMATLAPRTLSPRPSIATLSVQNTGTSTTSSIGTSSQPFPSRPEEPLALVRRAALDVLTSLRALEERARIPGPDPLPHSHSHSATNDGGSMSSRSDTPGEAEKGMFHSGDELEKESATSLSVSSPAARARAALPRLQTASGTHTETLLVHGRGAVQVWSESDDSESEVDEKEKREVWDERLVLGGGWLYRSDFGVGEVGDEGDVVRRYLDVVDVVLFGGPKGQKRGWERERRRGRKSENPVSDSEDDIGIGGSGGGMRFASLSLLSAAVVEEEEGEDEEEGGSGEDVPEWAQVEPFGSDLVARTTALLTHFLPPHLTHLLPSPPTRESLLIALSDGQLLCVAYNAAVRKSQKAWGFIHASSIHETAAGGDDAGGGGGGGGRTFRRKENLGLWAAALKLRYVIDIVPPPQKPSSKTKTRHFHEAPVPDAEEEGEGGGNQFSPIVIAKREVGWEDMFERAIWEWVNAVVSETKEAVGKV